MNPKISVIMPMYNVEKYVGCAIQSLLTQTFKDFEFIIVDDCSTDKSLDVAESFKDPRIKIIKNEKNLGAGLTRNVGLEIAVGDYIYFFDSDDALVPNALEILYDVAEKSQANVVSCTNYFIPSDNEFQTVQDLSVRVDNEGKNTGFISEDLKTRILNEYCNLGLAAAPWRMIFRHEFLNINKLYFPESPVHEDGIFLLKILCFTEKILKIGIPLCIYRERPGSLTHSISNVDIDRFASYVRSFLIVIKSFENALVTALRTNRRSPDRGGG